VFFTKPLAGIKILMTKALNHQRAQKYSCIFIQTIGRGKNNDDKSFKPSAGRKIQLYFHPNHWQGQK
jgi:hypothetical protein